MTNFYLQTVKDRMRSDDVLKRLNRHWTVQVRKVILWPACKLETVGLTGAAATYIDLVDPLCDWIHSRQCAYLARRYL